ncbi:MAG TPA: hydrogenase maturation protease [Dongiaceae bacterium]|nr:hydrogenase maturation protease [Dongiaceae bacterium]
MNHAGSVLVLGIGNLLMGDEGVGVHVIRQLTGMKLPEGVECLDGGTGSFLLLEPMQQATRIVLIDATIDGQPPGTVTRLTPKFSSDYPKTLTAHDIGLKDLLDAAYLTGEVLDVTLFAISIDPLQGLGMELSPAVAQRIDEISAMVLEEATRLHCAPGTQTFTEKPVFGSPAARG